MIRTASGIEAWLGPGDPLTVREMVRDALLGLESGPRVRRAMPEHKPEDGPRCGACEARFDTADELVAHIEQCPVAQDSPEMAAYRVHARIRQLVAGMDGKMRHCDACGSEYIDGAMCPVCYDAGKG